MSKCVACGGGFFRIQLAEPQGSSFKLYFVECASCGGVAGVMDFFNIGQMLKQQNTAIKRIANQVGVHVDLDCA